MEEVTKMSRTTCKLLTAFALALLLSIPAASATWEPMGYVDGGIAFRLDDGEPDFSNFSSLRFQQDDSDYEPAHLEVFPGFGLFNLAGTATPNRLFAEYIRQANTAKWKMLRDPTEGEVVSGAGLTVLWYDFQVVDDLYYRLDFDAILTAGYIATLDGNFPYPYTGRFLVQWKGLELTGKADDGWYFFKGGAKIHAEVIPDASTVTLFASGLLPMVALLRRRKA
jgi:hypothetical protein